MEDKKFEESWNKTRYQLELEGFTVTEEDKKDVQRVIQGQMSREQLIERLKKELSSEK
ncbi:antitoxin VbhA family protein [Salirhabdus sp. Marseille-P4669]|uniref:antitoxin VbhA family protein n=1 Tax=Salirhabdus sp. Marseille-P4669 TaxID=2042310 RepID=UPI0013588AD8|nr:antitoxin VbhA family protein [Salirhabdus sp. Marseille-P4669]